MAVLAEFLGPAAGDPSQLARRPLPFTLEVDALAGTRVADVALLLGLIALFYGVGRLLKASGLPRLRPFVVAAGLTGILMLFFTNAAFWEVKAIRVEADRVVLVKHLGADDALAWADLQRVELAAGKLFPAFTDDRRLVLVGRGEDQRLALPRFVPGVEAVVAEVAHRLAAPWAAPAPPAPVAPLTRGGPP